MKNPVSLLAVALLFGSAVYADDQVRNVQTELKKQGFFYGDVTGQSTTETGSALRRYQIRNGLEVTGTPSKETLDSLGLGGPKNPVAKAPPPPAPFPITKPPTNLRKDDGVEEGDRAFLAREEARRRSAEADTRITPMPYGPGSQRDPSVLAPPAPMDGPSDDFPVLFAQTPYATAPREIQQRVLRSAQATLASGRFYRDIIDGLPGPSTEEALLSYQRAARLTLTGRLDLETLSRLRLLPSRTSTRSPEPASGQRVYRGIWVN